MALEYWDKVYMLHNPLVDLRLLLMEKAGVMYAIMTDANEEDTYIYPTAVHKQFANVFSTAQNNLIPIPRSML